MELNGFFFLKNQMSLFGQNFIEIVGFFLLVIYRVFIQCLCDGVKLHGTSTYLWSFNQNGLDLKHSNCFSINHKYSMSGAFNWAEKVVEMHRV